MAKHQLFCVVRYATPALVACAATLITTIQQLDRRQFQRQHVRWFDGVLQLWTLTRRCFSDG